MNKEELRKQQPVVYEALRNACMQKRVSGAWLFHGPYGTPKKQAAILLAQSILCQSGEDLACGECSICRRVAEGIHPDVIILDGSQKGISKEEIDGIQERFSRTSLENGERVYVILNAENASIAAQNSMLKFLEEPGAGVTAVLTTDQIGRLLPTIISRCTALPFVPLSQEACMEAAIQEGIPEEDAYFLSHTARDTEEIRQLYESDEYGKAMQMFRQFLNADGVPREELLVDYDISYRAQGSDRQKAKEANMRLLRMFFDLLLMYAEDQIRKEERGPVWYGDLLRSEKKCTEYYADMVILVTQERDRINKYNDLNLLMDQAFCRLEDLEHEYSNGTGG